MTGYPRGPFLPSPHQLQTDLHHHRYPFATELPSSSSHNLFTLAPCHHIRKPTPHRHPAAQSHLSFTVAHRRSNAPSKSHTQSKASASGSPLRRGGLRFSTVNTLKPSRISSTTGDPFFRQPSQRLELVAAASLVIIAPPTPPVAALLDPSVRAPCVVPPQPPTVASTVSPAPLPAPPLRTSPTVAHLARASHAACSSPTYSAAPPALRSSATPPAPRSSVAASRHRCSAPPAPPVFSFSSTGQLRLSSLSPLRGSFKTRQP
ncbi:hypothetical protein U1Q18_031957 [Sarracenia purpurea var. burkii]